MTASRDEINRQLRDAAAEQRDALPRFSRALRRAADPDSGTSAEEQAALLGLPHSRRGFLRLGGLTVAASAFLVSCGLGSSTEEVNITRTGPTLAPSSNTVPAPTPGPELDLTLLLTAGSLEALAIATYDAAIEAGWLGSPALDDVARLFRDQHTEHLGAVSDATRSVGGTPYEEPNPFLYENVVRPAAEKIAGLEPADQTLEAMNLAYTLEDVAAQTYTSAGGLFSSAQLRQAGMSIGAVEARHISVILSALEEPAAPFPFARTVNAVDEAAFITPSGPATKP